MAASARNIVTTIALELLIPAARGRSLPKTMSAPARGALKLRAIRRATVLGYTVHPCDGIASSPDSSKLVACPETTSRAEITASLLRFATTQMPRSAVQSRLRPPA
jgi:hypothetical protein